MMIIFIVLIGVVLYYAFEGKGNIDIFDQKHKNDSNEILKEKFVNGEIDEKTYLQMKETLKK